MSSLGICSAARYPSVACDLLTSDVPQVTEMLASEESLMNVVYAFLESEEDLNPLQASFFSKLVGILIARKSDMVYLAYSYTVFPNPIFTKSVSSHKSHKKMMPSIC